MKSFEINGKKVGPGHPSFIIAEAGVNHNGNLQLAHDLVDAAATIGADAVKFQTWVTEKICKPGALKADYQQLNSPDEADQYAMLKRLELPYAWHSELKRHAEERKIIFLSTPDEMQSARFLYDLGIPAIKVGSGELTNLPFLRELSGLGKPLILSTGMGTLDNVKNAVDAVQSVSDVPVALLHCLSAYPAPEEEMNLRAISTLRREFEVPVGLSDHTMTALAATLGVGIGMDIFEKHLTLDRNMPGPDQAASATPNEFSELIKTVRKAEVMLGSGVKILAKSEANTQQTVQRTVLYAKDFRTGHVLSGADMDSLRCGLPGFPPAAIAFLTGRRLRHPVMAGAIVAESDLI